MTNVKQQDLLSQAKTEFDLAKDTMSEKWQQWQTNLKLYNNSKRDKEAIGASLLYTLFNTLLSFLYFDKLSVSFLPRESGDVERCDLITQLAKFDYEEMERGKVNYDLLWDSLFFGNGFLYVGGMKNQTPEIEVIDPFTIYIDPQASSIQSARFIALERQMTVYEMEERGFKDVDKLINPPASQTKDAAQARKEAKNEVDPNEPKDYVNKYYVILEWFSTREGKKVHFFTDYNCSLLLKEEKFVFKDDEFPFVNYRFSPIPHTFWSISVPDLLEDKQRAMAVLLNLSLELEKLKLYPRYLFDSNAIQNIQDLKNVQFNKYIPVNAAGRSVRDIVAPMEQSSLTTSTDALYSMIRDFAERSIGTPSLKQGIVSSGKRTATELQLASINADTRNSLSAKLFSLSEIDFWSKWLHRYQQFKALAKNKIIRIQGSLGVRFETLQTDTFKFKSDPDIIIESSNVAAQKKLMDRQILTEMSSVIVDQSTPESAKRYYKRKLLQLSDFSKDEIDQILPMSFDELRAYEENKLLEQGRVPVIEPYDDHYIHISIHNQVPVNSETRRVIIAHIQTHKDAFLKDREKERKEATEPKEKGINKGELEKFTKSQVPIQPPQVPVGQEIGNLLNTPELAQIAQTAQTAQPAPQINPTVPEQQ